MARYCTTTSRCSNCHNTPNTEPFVTHPDAVMFDWEALSRFMEAVSPEPQSTLLGWCILRGSSSSSGRWWYRCRRGHRHVTRDLQTSSWCSRLGSQFVLAVAHVTIRGFCHRRRARWSRKLRSIALHVTRSRANANVDTTAGGVLLSIELGAHVVRTVRHASDGNIILQVRLVAPTVADQLFPLT